MSRRITCVYCGKRLTLPVIPGTHEYECYFCKNRFTDPKKLDLSGIPHIEAVCPGGHYYYLVSPDEDIPCPICGSRERTVTRNIGNWRILVNPRHGELREIYRDYLRRSGTTGYVSIDTLVSEITTTMRDVPCVRDTSALKHQFIARAALILERYARYSEHSRAWRK